MAPDDTITTESLINEIRQTAGKACPHCHEPITLGDALKCRAFGFAKSPCCTAGLAQALGHSAEELEESTQNYFNLHECYQGAWQWIQEQK